jgi:UDP-GlcNAc:undecaprenyl-phosphate GlcNAc-1-phosphate transferase
MGDTGSMFLGFVLATTAIQTNQKSSTAVAVLIPAITLGLPIMDTLLAIGRRAIRGRPLFQADREHIHHRLMALGLSQRQTVLVLYGLCVMLGAAALVLTYASSGQSALVLSVLALVAFFFLRTLGYVRLDRIPESAVDRKRNRALRAALRPLGRRLRQLHTPDEMWPVVIEAGGVLGAVLVSLQVEKMGTEDASPATHATFTHRSEDGASGELLRVRFSVPGGKHGDRTLELGWNDGRVEIDRDTEIAVDILCEHLGEALDVYRPLAVEGLRSPHSAPRA